MLDIKTDVDDPLLPDTHRPDTHQEQSDKPTKRIRLQNFTERENELLVNLAYQEVAVLENKTGLARSNELKHNMWRAITKVFNSYQIGIERDHISLRYRYENLKRRLRKKVMDHKKGLAKGDIVKLFMTAYETKLLKMMAHKPDGVEVLENGVIKVVGKGSMRHVKYVECHEDDEEAEFTDSISNDPTFSPIFDDPCDTPVDPLIINSDDQVELPNRPSTSRALATTNPTSSKNNIVVTSTRCRQYLNSSIGLLEETVDRNSESDDGNKRREKEHQLRMKFMKDEHETKMKYLAEELKMKKEEHELRMKLLKRKLHVLTDDI